MQVAAIAVITAIGSGVYVGLSSSSQWRRTSYDASYEALASHDVLATTAEGTFAEQGRLLAALDAMVDPDRVAMAEERLQMPTQVDAREVAGKTLLVPGRIVGVDGSGGGPHVDRLEMVGGRALQETDIGTGRVILDSHFAEHHDLPDRGTIETGGGTVEYVGTGYSPEYFLVASGGVSFLAEAGFAVMFAPLEDAQRLTGADGLVNQVALVLADGADLQDTIEDFEAALATEAPELAVEVTALEDERLYRRLYDDIDGDQRLFNIFAMLILGGAAFAAFNLTGRIVEAQRREIGIGMALGLERAQLAARPLLVGLQVSLLGVLFGVGFGLLVGRLVADLNLDFVPLPVWNDTFQPWVFLRGAILAIALVFVATVMPVSRAVRVDPIEAIRVRPGRSAGGTSRISGRRRGLAGNSIRQLPFGNVMRSPRRTALSMLGIASAIAVLVALTGMMDSMNATIDMGEAEILGGEPERTTVTLDFFYPVDSPEVIGVGESAAVYTAEPQLVVGGELLDGAEEIEQLITFVDLSSEIWAPTAMEGTLDADGPGLVISEKAAEDLGVGPGDTVTLRHPQREGFGYSFVESELVVEAVHPNPYRFVSYLDLDDASLMGLEGIVNAVSVTPAAGYSQEDIKISLFGQSGVAAIEGVNEVADTIRDSLEELLGLLVIIQAFVLLMALLIAFNSTSISSDERRREHATMLAFGLPLRTVVGLVVTESFLIGAMGTALGILVGRALLSWIVKVLLPTSVPDLGIVVEVSASTYLTAAVLGVIAVSVAPLFTVPRLRRMDIPATLRVVE